MIEPAHIAWSPDEDDDELPTVEQPFRLVRLTENVQLWQGDCRDVLDALDPESVDSVVCDPPYGLTFMGKDWDHGVPAEHFWTEALRVLKPGGYLLAFGGTRTFHRLAVAIEDAGFEIRDCLSWMYGSGFPKSLDVSKAIDKMGGDPAIITEMAEVLKAAREARGMTVKQADAHFCGSSTAWPWYEGRPYKGQVRVFAPEEERANLIAAEWPETAAVFEKMRQKGAFKGTRKHARSGGEDFGKVVGSTAESRIVDEFDHGTPEAERWEGWGTALKPAWEPIIMARKPFKATVAANVLEHGTGALNIDATRISTSENLNGGAYAANGNRSESHSLHGGTGMNVPGKTVGTEFTQPSGRWPANVLLSHTEECVQVGTKTVRATSIAASKPTEAVRQSLSDSLQQGTGMNVVGKPQPVTGFANDDGTETVEAWQCVEDCPVRLLDEQSSASRFFYTSKVSKRERNAGMPEGSVNDHPTAKPIAVMRWLVRMVTQPGGVVCDPFMGSGSTGCAACTEGFRFVGVDLDPHYVDIAAHRIAYAELDA